MALKVTIFGLGAIGSNLLVQMLKQFPDFEYVGIDFDKVEERNIRTQAYFLEHVGMPKVQACRAIAQRFLRKPNYVPKNEKVKEPFKFEIEKGTKNNLYVVCFDNTASRKLVKPAHDCNVLHLGFSPFYTAECIWNERYEVPGDVDAKAGDICSMDDAVSFIHYFVNLAVLTISDFVKEGKKSSFLITHRTKVRPL